MVYVPCLGTTAHVHRMDDRARAAQAALEGFQAVAESDFGG